VRLNAGSVATANDDELDSVSRDVNDVNSDVSLGDESRHDTGDSASSDDVTDHYPAEVIVEGQQMNKVGRRLVVQLGHYMKLNGLNVTRLFELVPL